MKLLDIVKTVGAGIVREAVPGGGLIVDAVNALLPDEHKLQRDATGDDIAARVSKLPPEQQAAVLAKEFDVDIAQIRESNATVRAMLEADYKTPHTTRPYIAKGAFQVVAVCTLAVIFTWCYGVLMDKAETVKAAQEGATFMLYVLGPLVTLLWAYFGVLQQEQRNRLNAAQGAPAGGLGTLLGSLIKRKG